ncbi:hypothetical protein P3L10_026114 [Capsicum annuum]
MSPYQSFSSLAPVHNSSSLVVKPQRPGSTSVFPTLARPSRACSPPFWLQDYVQPKKKLLSLMLWLSFYLMLIFLLHIKR